VSIRSGFFAVKNVGILFQKILNIPMEEQGSQNYKYFGQPRYQKLRNKKSWKLHQLKKINH